MKDPNFNDYPEVVVEVQGIVVVGYLLCVTETTSVVMFEGAEFPVTYDNDTLTEVDIDAYGDKVIPPGGSVLCSVTSNEQEIH